MWMIEECSWWSIDAISSLHWNFLVNLCISFFIHFSLFDKEIDLERGALVEDIYLVLLSESCGYREYFYHMISYSLIFYFSSIIVLFLGRSKWFDLWLGRREGTFVAPWAFGLKSDLTIFPLDLCGNSLHHFGIHPQKHQVFSGKISSYFSIYLGLHFPFTQTLI